MKKCSRVIAIMATFCAVLMPLSGCSGDLGKLLPDSSGQGESSAQGGVSAQEELLQKLAAEQVGNTKRTNLITGDGGVYYTDENKKYGVMSLDGQQDTGAKYTSCEVKGPYFAVSTKQPTSYTDIAALNAVGLIDGKGNTVVPFQYASFKVLNDRYVQVIQVTARTYSRDDALVHYSKNAFSFSAGDDALFKGKWSVYDVTTGSKVPGVSGTSAAPVTASGSYITYYTDAQERKVVNGKGQALPDGAKAFDDGSYAVEEKSGTVFGADGTVLFGYDLTGFTPSGSTGDYYIAGKYVDGKTNYVVMDKTGQVVSSEFTSSITLYGDLILCDGKLYNFDGKTVIDGTYTSVTYDKLFGNAWLLRQDDRYTLLNDEGTVLYQGRNKDDISVSSSDFMASCKKGNESYYYSYKDQDYTIPGYSFAPWIVQANNANSLYNLVDTISGEALLEGYKSYRYSTAGDTALFVYAEYNGGTDIFQILGGNQVKPIEDMKANLLEDLAGAFKTAGISVSVNDSTGELAMDSSVLFGGDSATLTSEGKAFLNTFIKAYVSIVCSDSYDGFVSRTMIEGHTAPVAGSTYESGLQLSEERAANVKAYCLSSETGVDVTKLADSLESVGYSNSKPVYDADGQVDMDASRRVSFRIIVHVDRA